MEDDDEDQVQQTCPTLEEFTGMVKEYFKCYCQVPQDDEVDRYFESDIAKRTILTAYNNNLERFTAGELRAYIFRYDCAASVAECLSLLY